MMASSLLGMRWSEARRIMESRWLEMTMMMMMTMTMTMMMMVMAMMRADDSALRRSPAGLVPPRALHRCPAE